MVKAINPHPSSYRDPSGFVFEKNGAIYRQVNKSFQEHFDHFIESGCYQHLVDNGWLIPHEPVAENLTGDCHYYTTLKPERIPFISYPYEWSFDMLKDAALLTLQLVKKSLDYGMILKDATPFNIQWYKGRLLFIDTLSFEKYREVPWIGYRQFCENFLGPLLLMHYSKQPLQALLLSWPDGVPLAVIQSLLPKRSRWSLHTYLHIHLHAAMAAKNESNKNAKPFSKQKLLNLVTSLETVINKLKLPDQKSTWSGYYMEASQRDTYLEEKKKIINNWVDRLNPVLNSAADIGANEGEFSKLLSQKNIPVLSSDFDPFCINRLYSSIKKNREKNIQPLIVDFSHPSPAIGVNNEERTSFIKRTKVDITLALALIHHLVIAKNISFSMVAGFLERITGYLIIEFVPVQDDKVQFMLKQKAISFDGYDQENFESSFKQYFDIVEKEIIPGSYRTLYLMKNKPPNEDNAY